MRFRTGLLTLGFIGTLSSANLACSPQPNGPGLTIKKAEKLSISGPAQVVSGVCSEVYTVISQDNQSLVATMTSDLVLGISGKGAAELFSDSACTLPVTDLRILSGSFLATFYIRDSTPETLTLSISADAIEAVTHATEVLPTVARLSMQGPAAAIVNQCSSAIEVTTIDQKGQAHLAAAPLVIELGGAGQGKFYSDDFCATETTNALIDNGKSSTKIYFKSAIAETLTLTAQSGKLGRGELPLTVSEGEVTQLSVSGPSSVQAGTCSDGISVKSRDALGDLQAVGADTSLTVSGLASGSTYADSACTVPLVAPALLAGQDTFVFYYKNNTASSPVLAIDASTYPQVTHSLTVNPGAPSATTSTVVASPPSGVYANGSSASNLTVTLKDLYGNACPGQTVTVASTGSGTSITQPGAVTDSNGQTSAVIRSTAVETKTVSVSGPAGLGAVSATVEFIQPPLSLEVPIEILGQGVGSGTGVKTFDHSRTSLTTTDYDGTVTYFFEIVVENTGTDPETVSLLDESGTQVAAQTVAAGISVPTRARIAFSPTVGAHDYRVRLTGTTSNSLLKVYAARILVKQVGATKTKLYIPLTSGVYSSTSIDLNASIDSTKNTSYTQGASAPYSIWLKESNRYADIQSWNFQAVLRDSGSGTNAFASLYNRTTGLPVTGSEISESNSSYRLVTSGAISNANMTDSHEFEVKIKSASASRTAYIAKAGLWLKLTNLSRAQVLYRVGGSELAGGTSFSDVQHRTLIDLSYFASSTVNAAVNVFFETVGMVSTVAGASGRLFQNGTNDSGTGGASLVSNSVLPFGTTKARTRSSALSLTNGDRYYHDLDRVSGTATISSAWIVVDFQ